jgi:hypothetical protein
MSTPGPQKTRSPFFPPMGLELTFPSRPGSLVVDWTPRETDSDPQQNPATHPTAPARPSPSPLVSGPPEASSFAFRLLPFAFRF